MLFELLRCTHPHKESTKYKTVTETAPYKDTHIDTPMRILNSMSWHSSHDLTVNDTRIITKHQLVTRTYIQKHPCTSSTQHLDTAVTN